jgi:hypothetical protein
MGSMYLAVAEDEQQVPWRGWLAGAQLPESRTARPPRTH